jgi:hypothetical protein
VMNATREPAPSSPLNCMFHVGLHRNDWLLKRHPTDLQLCACDRVDRRVAGSKRTVICSCIDVGSGDVDTGTEADAFVEFEVPADGFGPSFGAALAADRVTASNP